MTITQQLSPSSLRAYKLSKYANGQPGKILLEAKKAQRATSQFMSKSGAKEVAKRMKDLKNTAANAKKVADATKKATDLTEKIQSALFKNILGSAVIDKASRVGGILGILSAIGLVLLVKLQEFVTGRAFDDLSQIGIELTKTNTIAVNNGLKIKTIQSKVDKFDKELDANAKDFARLNKQTDTIAKNAVDAKKQATDALYEAREGRKIVTGLAEVARKLANDALYEARANKTAIEAKITEQRVSFEAKIQSINATISKFNNSVSEAFQKSVNVTISKIQSDLAATKAQVNAIRPQAVDTNNITTNAVAAARALVTPLQSQVGLLAGTIGSLQGQVAQIPVLASSVGNLAQSLNTVNSKADAAMNEARNKGVPNLTPIQQQLDEKFNQFVADNNKALNIRDLQQSNLSKELDKKLNDFERQSNLTSDQRFDEFKKDNNKALGIVELTQSNLSKEFDAKFSDFQRQSNLTADQRFEEFQRTNKESLGLLKTELKQTTKEVEDNKITITKIDTKLGEQVKVNEQALPKLDQILGILPAIPARAAAAIRPDIPTIPQIEQAAATGTCRTTQPGGCMNKVLKDNAADITNNNNTNAANILDAVNTGANAALLAGQQTILQRLGDQLPGGIGGKLTRFAQWAHLDRVLNIMNFAASVHNGAMLSNNLGQTLLSVVGNLLSIVGLKDAEGQAFDIGSVISKGIEGLIKSAIGEENYKTLDATWKRANRIYQAAANLLNSIQSLSASILSALEVIGQWNAKVANSLKRFGVVGEKAYSWMNPNVNFQNKYFTALENATNVISQVDQVASEVLSIKETVGQIVEQKKELDDSLKETDASKQKADLPEAVKLA
ncbi:hypothetical protein [Nostoc sp. NMS8]|uniref:hypothetical protein n=1 Tax=Nostoc sp. NMS8 TaxID=2815392 RepID=UPI0025E1369E|nr:hypothetical protein [Nostoc sp. NMS8]MBN3959255.1 hypothetical protein [Nostoc sp. NMS8]